MERFFHIDFMRFLAIFFVTGFHIARYMGYNNLHSFGAIFKNAFITGGWLGCCLFFLISGYTLSMKYDEKSKYFDFIKKKLLRLLPTYYIAIIFWYFLVNMKIAPKPIDTSAILSHIFLIHNLSPSNFYSVSGVFWFLGCLFNLYLLFPFLYKLQHKTKYGLEIFTLSAFIINIFCIIVFNLNNDVFRKSVFINLPCFTFGMILYNQQDTKLIKNKYFINILIITTIALLVFAKNSKFIGIPINMLAIFESILIGIICVALRNKLHQIPIILKEFITQIAVASYSIYLYNYIFHCAKPVCRNSVIIFIYILFVFGFGLCMYKLIEQPLNKFLKNKLKQYIT